jgi:hypothetical protein
MKKNFWRWMLMTSISNVDVLNTPQLNTRKMVKMRAESVA